MSTSLKLEKIIIEGLQARARTDEATVAEYAEAWINGEKFPDVVVFHDGTNYYLGDGFHRSLGAIKAGLKDINADVRKGTRKDAVWFAVAANQTHGLKRTNADKRKAVELAIKEKPELADNAIAAHVGVSWDLVKSVRGQVPVPEPDSTKPPTKREGLDGKKYPAPPVPQLPPPPVAPAPPSRPAPTPPVASKPPTKPAEPPPVLDKVGWMIPASLLPAWREQEETYRECVNYIARLKGHFKRLQETKYTGRGDAQEVFAGLSTVQQNIEIFVPYAVCPQCLGQVSDTCILCGHSGILSKFHWDTCVTEETKSMREKIKGAKK